MNDIEETINQHNQALQKNEDKDEEDWSKIIDYCKRLNDEAAQRGEPLRKFKRLGVSQHG